MYVYKYLQQGTYTRTYFAAVSNNPIKLRKKLQ